MSETVWDTLENKATAVCGVLQTTPWGGESIVVSGSASGTEENKAYYEALGGTFAVYPDASIEEKMEKQEMACAVLHHKEGEKALTLLYEILEEGEASWGKASLETLTNKETESRVKD